MGGPYIIRLGLSYFPAILSSISNTYTGKEDTYVKKIHMKESDKDLLSYRENDDVPADVA